MGNNNEPSRIVELRKNGIEKEAEEQRLLDNYKKNLIVLAGIKDQKLAFEAGEIDQEMLSVLLSIHKVEIDLTPEEQWQTINDILSMKDIANGQLREIQSSLMSLRERSVQSSMRVVELMLWKNELYATLGQPAEYDSVDERYSLTSCDYIKEITKPEGNSNYSNSKAKEIFDYIACINMDARAEAIIKGMLTTEEKIEALKTTRLFETTREKILLDPEIQRALREEAKAQSDLHAGKQREKQGLIKRLTRMFGRGNGR